MNWFGRNSDKKEQKDKKKKKKQSKRRNFSGKKSTSLVSAMKLPNATAGAVKNFYTDPGSRGEDELRVQVLDGRYLLMLLDDKLISDAGIENKKDNALGKVSTGLKTGEFVIVGTEAGNEAGVVGLIPSNDLLRSFIAFPKFGDSELKYKAGLVAIDEDSDDNELVLSDGNNDVRLTLGEWIDWSEGKGTFDYRDGKLMFLPPSESEKEVVDPMKSTPSEISSLNDDDEGVDPDSYEPITKHSNVDRFVSSGEVSQPSNEDLSMDPTTIAQSDSNLVRENVARESNEVTISRAPQVNKQQENIAQSKVSEPVVNQQPTVNQQQVVQQRSVIQQPQEQVQSNSVTDSNINEVVDSQEKAEAERARLSQSVLKVDDISVSDDKFLKEFIQRRWVEPFMMGQLQDDADFSTKRLNDLRSDFNGKLATREKELKAKLSNAFYDARENALTDSSNYIVLYDANPDLNEDENYPDSLKKLLSDTEGLLKNDRNVIANNQKKLEARFENAKQNAIEQAKLEAASQFERSERPRLNQELKDFEQSLIQKRKAEVNQKLEEHNSAVERTRNKVVNTAMNEAYENLRNDLDNYMSELREIRDEYSKAIQSTADELKTEQKEAYTSLAERDKLDKEVLRLKDELQRINESNARQLDGLKAQYEKSSEIIEKNARSSADIEIRRAKDEVKQLQDDNASLLEQMKVIKEQADQSIVESDKRHEAENERYIKQMSELKQEVKDAREQTQKSMVRSRWTTIASVAVAGIVFAGVGTMFGRTTGYESALKSVQQNNNSSQQQNTQAPVYVLPQQQQSSEQHSSESKSSQESQSSSSSEEQGSSAESLQESK